MNWHTTTKVSENVYRISEPFGAVEPRVGVKTVNMYLVIGTDRAVLIDSGMGIGDLAAEVGARTDLPCLVLNTHYHWDHIGANARFPSRAIHHSEKDLVAMEPDVSDVREAMRAPGAMAALPAGFDPAAYRILTVPATQVLEDGDRIDLGGRSLRVLHTPGHSPGHVCVFDEGTGILFTGDTAFRGPLYACFQLSDPGDFLESVKRLAAQAGVSTICPGHNDLIEEPDWLRHLAEGVERAVTGQVKGQRRDGYITGVGHAFGDFTVWLPVEGSIR